MSLSAQISISSDNATPEVAKLMESVAPQRLAAICRDPLRGFWRDRLKKYPRLPGKFAAFPPTGFGEESAESIEAYAGNGFVSMTANKIGLRAQYEGAVIRPVHAKVLCFAIAPESYGKSYAEMRAELDVAARQKSAGKKGVPSPGGADADKAKRAQLSKLFAFAKETRLTGNLALVPTSDEFQEIAMEAILRRLAITN